MKLAYLCEGVLDVISNTMALTSLGMTLPSAADIDKMPKKSLKEEFGSIESIDSTMKETKDEMASNINNAISLLQRMSIKSPDSIELSGLIKQFKSLSGVNTGGLGADNKEKKKENLCGANGLFDKLSVILCAKYRDAYICSCDNSKLSNPIKIFKMVNAKLKELNEEIKSLKKDDRGLIELPLTTKNNIIQIIDYSNTIAKAASLQIENDSDGMAKLATMLSDSKMKLIHDCAATICAGMLSGDNFYNSVSLEHRVMIEVYARRDRINNIEKKSEYDEFVLHTLKSINISDVKMLINDMAALGFMPHFSKLASIRPSKTDIKPRERSQIQPTHVGRRNADEHDPAADAPAADSVK